MTDDSILDKIESPSDLKELSDEERTKLAFEIREEIVNTVAKTVILADAPSEKKEIFPPNALL